MIGYINGLAEVRTITGPTFKLLSSFRISKQNYIY